MIEKKLTSAKQKRFTFNQINKLTTNFFSPLRCSYISFYLMFQIPMCHRQFF